MTEKTAGAPAAAAINAEVCYDPTLPGMVVQVIGSFGQQQVVLAAALEERYQHRGGSQVRGRDSAVRVGGKGPGEPGAVEHQAVTLTAASRRAVMVAA